MNMQNLQAQGQDFYLDQTCLRRCCLHTGKQPVQGIAHFYSIRFFLNFFLFVCIAKRQLSCGIESLATPEAPKCYQMIANGFPCLEPLVQRVGSAPSWPERSAEFHKHCLENLV